MFRKLITLGLLVLLTTVSVFAQSSGQTLTLDDDYEIVVTAPAEAGPIPSGPRRRAPGCERSRRARVATRSSTARRCGAAGAAGFCADALCAARLY